MVLVMKIMVTSFKRSHDRHCCTQCPPNLHQATANSRLHQRLLDTHGQVWVNLLWGHCSFLLGHGPYKVLFEPSKKLFPQGNCDRSCLWFSQGWTRLKQLSSSSSSMVSVQSYSRGPISVGSRVVEFSTWQVFMVDTGFSKSIA